MKRFSIAAILLLALLGSLSATVVPLGPHRFSDDDWRIYDGTTPSKMLAFEVSGISEDTTRTWTVPDRDLDLGSPVFYKVIVDSVEINGETIHSPAGDLYLSADSSVYLTSGGPIYFKPSLDTTDFIMIRTLGDVPEITTEGSCNLKITSSGGTINFDDEHLQTTGNLTDGTNSLTVAEANEAYDHSVDNTQAHTDYMLNTGDTASGDYTFDGTTLHINSTDNRVGIGTSSPDSVFHIKAGTPGTVGSHPAGQLIIQNPTDSVFACAVITGYESDGDGNPDQQLWYLGSSSSSNSDIIFLNRRNSKLALGTNGSHRITILGNGNVGIGTTTPSSKLSIDGGLHVGGDSDAGDNNLLVDGTLGAGAITGTSLTISTTGEINFRDTDISIGSTLFDGILDMSADISIDMFYDNADVGDGVDGQNLNINRRAGEGDDWISLYVDKDRKGLIGFSGDDDLLQLAANALTVNGTVAWTGGGSANANTAHTHIGESGASHSLLDVTPGTVTASKAIVVDASKNIGTLGTVLATTLSDGTFSVTGGLATWEGGGLQNFTMVEVGSLTDSTKLDKVNRLYVSGGYIYAVAYEGANTYFTILDPNIPANPIIVGSLTTGIGNVDGLWVAGKYAYLIETATPSGKLQVIDISNPSAPSIVGSASPASDFEYTGECMVVGKYAYVVAIGSDALSIIDVSDPTTPVEVGNTTTLATLNGAHGVYVVGNYAYVAASLYDGLTVVDISDPTAPVVAGTVTDAQLNGAGDVEVRGRFAYVTAEDGDYLTIVDIKDPTTPTIIGSVTDGTNLDGVDGIHLMGNYAICCSTTGDKLTLVDISDPTVPAVVGTPISVDGDDVYVSGRYAYVANEAADTIKVYRIVGIETPTASIGDLQADIAHVRQYLDVGQQLNVHGGANIGYNLFVDDDIFANGTIATNVTVSTPELYNTAGDLKIMPDVQGDVHLFGDTDVGNDDIGKYLYVHRKAAEGDTYVRIFCSSTKTPTIYGSLGMIFAATGNVTFQATDDARIKLGDAAGAKKFSVLDSGYNVEASVNSYGEALFLGSYSKVIGGTNIDLYMDNTGLLGPDPSAAHFKENIRDIESSERIHQLRPVHYDRKDGTGAGLVGLIADDVATVIPEAVAYKYNPINEYVYDEEAECDVPVIVGWEKTDELLTVNMTRLVPFLIAEVQKLRVDVEELKAEIETLKAVTPVPASNSGTTDVRGLVVVALIALAMLYINKSRKKAAKSG